MAQTPATSSHGGDIADESHLKAKASQLPRGYLVGILRAALRPSRIELDEVRKVLRLISFAGKNPVELYQEAVSDRPADYDPPPPLADVLPSDAQILATDLAERPETEDLLRRSSKPDSDVAQWFYMDGSLRRGPLTMVDLIRGIWSKDDPVSALVWQPGMPNWQTAGAVIEVAARLPPPAPAMPASHGVEVTPPPELAPSAASSSAPATSAKRPSFGRIYAWNALAWGCLSVAGACLQFLETKRTADVVFLNFVGSVVGSLLVFAPVTALLTWVGVRWWGAAFKEP